jgi:hypothetical protein
MQFPLVASNLHPLLMFGRPSSTKYPPKPRNFRHKTAPCISSDAISPSIRCVCGVSLLMSTWESSLWPHPDGLWRCSVWSLSRSPSTSLDCSGSLVGFATIRIHREVSFTGCQNLPRKRMRWHLEIGLQVREESDGRCCTI